VRRIDIYNNIVDSFARSYSWLGRQFAEEFLLSVSSSNIQRFSKPKFRIRRHLMLFWDHAWFKTTLLTRAKEWLGPELCMSMSDISNAALRGTVESGQFMSPYTLKTPFAVATEFGQVISGTDYTELVQKLLCVLEEGEITVSLGKIAYLSSQQREEAEEKYGVTFVDNNTFTYKTNWVLLAATYNRKFMVDNAFESRFNIMYPERKLDNKLTRYINKAPPYQMDNETVFAFRREIQKEKPISTNIKLPDEIFDSDKTVTPRQCGALQSYILCRAWWGLKTPKETILEKLEQMWARSDEIWKTADDRVLEALNNKPKTVQELAKELNLSERQIYYSLKNLRGFWVKYLKSDETVGYKKA